jgi:hypothetical protein
MAVCEVSGALAPKSDGCTLSASCREHAVHNILHIARDSDSVEQNGAAVCFDGGAAGDVRKRAVQQNNISCTLYLQPHWAIGNVNMRK